LKIEVNKDANYYQSKDEMKSILETTEGNQETEA